MIIYRGILYSIRSSMPQVSTLLLLYAMNFGELKTKVQQQPDDLQIPAKNLVKTYLV